MDKKAKNILMKTYWSASGWKDEYTITPKDFTYAKEKGLMFDAVSISHDKCVKQIKAIVEKITPQQIVKAFISSLSSRRLDWRSGISSYYIAKMLPMHTYTPVISGKSYENGKVVYTSCTCSICKDLKYGVIGKEYYKDVDVNILNFERIKWGGCLPSPPATVPASSGETRCTASTSYAIARPSTFAARSASSPV